MLVLVTSSALPKKCVIDLREYAPINIGSIGIKFRGVNFLSYFKTKIASVLSFHLPAHLPPYAHSREAEADEPLLIQQSCRLFQKLNPSVVVFNQVVVDVERI